MQIEQAYNKWAEQYDINRNRTRDLEAEALRATLEPVAFSSCLEIGCGTGKNTVWLAARADKTTSVDLSGEMLAKARQKVSDATHKVDFIQADIEQSWNFTQDTYDLISFSLVLEHIENLDHIFSEAARRLRPGGWVYAGELHPFKQYLGTRARFETEEGMQVVECYNHHVSDFTGSAAKQRLHLAKVSEYFDDGNRTGVPRVLALLFQKA